jgi:hypothetical protein
MSTPPTVPTSSHATRALRLVLGAGLVLGLAANLPGHMSTDSLNAVFEARYDLQTTWAPVAYAWVVGLFDSALAGVGLYVAASSALLFAALAALPSLRARTSWLAVPAAAAIVATPQVLIYQGIVWRDVLFANLAVAAFVLIAVAARRWTERPPWLALGLSLACLALAASVRQNGVIFLVAATPVVAWLERKGGWRRRAVWGFGWLALGVLLMAAISQVAQPPARAPGLRPDAGIRILEHYDVVGVAARDPGLSLAVIAHDNPAAAATLRAGAARAYSPARVDTLDSDPAFRRSLWKTPDDVMAAQWRDVVLRHPAVYLRHRFSVFRWTVAPPDLMACLPLQVGIGGSPDVVRSLELAPADPGVSARLLAYAKRFFATPVYSHVTYGVLALALIGLLARRRDPADIAVMGLLAGALLFAASFFVISIACDYRYLYALDLAALTGLLYLAIDPRLRRT